MTFDLRARAKELATKSLIHSELWDDKHDEVVKSIESALLAFAREVLTQEPDREMLIVGTDHVHRWHQGYTASMLDTAGAYKAMSAQRAKSLEDGA